MAPIDGGVVGDDWNGRGIAGHNWGLNAKPCGILNVLGYYSPLLQMFEHAVEERFLKPENRALVLAGDRLPNCCKGPVHLEKWLGRETR